MIECTWNVITFLAVTIIVDIGSRRFPLSLGVLGLATAGLMAWFCGHSIWFHVLGGLAAVSLGAIADVPGGDLKFLLVFGLMVGPTIALWSLIPAFLLTLLAWSKGLTGLPWTVYIGIGYSIVTLVYSYVQSHSIAQ